MGRSCRTDRFAILATACAALGATAARAELPPQYIVQQEIGAVAGQTEVVMQLGIIDKIERTNSGYLVTGGKCSLLARVIREGSKGSNGEPMPGPSRIVRIYLGPKQCS